MTVVHHREVAPEGSTFSRWAFHQNLGISIPLKVAGDEVGRATLIGAIPADDRTSVELVFEIDEIRAELWNEVSSLSFDDFSSADELNPGRALRTVERKGYLLETSGDTQRYTWDTVPIGHYVPGSGKITAKWPHTPARGWHVTFDREHPFKETWSTFHTGTDKVPIALTSEGLRY